MITEPHVDQRDIGIGGKVSSRPGSQILHDLHRLQWFDHTDEGRLRGWRSIHITDSDHPYMKNWWVPGLQLGYLLGGNREGMTR